ncbi:LacI family DNA-binding transcriptional regulator [Georgenia deserti]|uniref:LacI family DNA-binding transcriptional regulator n=1 Tax=Georgenia deserti TaxID=2093781 RepID=A0ABW4LAA4_9MICO
MTPAQERPGPGRRATIRDVAEAAGVSQSTASRALTGRGYAAEPVRRRVQDAAERLGYVPDAMARHLKQRVSRSVGVLVHDLRNSFYADLAAGAGQAARDRGYTLTLTDLGRGQTEEVAAAEAFVAMRVAGVIATPVSGAVVDYLDRHGVPVVEVDRQFAPAVCDAVVVDNHGGARAATDHLLDLGHRRIALLIDETDWTTGRERHRGFCTALEARGLSVADDLVVATGWDVTAAQTATERLLAADQRPTAIFAANNLLAEGAWRAASDAGLTIPQDLSLVSFDDAPWMTMVRPEVTAVVQDAVAVGAAAVDRLLTRLDDGSADLQTVVLPAPLVVRGSTGALRR